MHKFIASLVLILATVGLNVPTQANAFVTHRAPDACVGEGGSRGSFITTCVSPAWARQADGTGVRLEGFHVNTPDGCLALEDSGGRYNPVRPLWVDPSNERIDYSYNFGAEDCNFSKNLSNAGSDTGPMDFRFIAKARVDLGEDHNVYMGWTLWPDGRYRLNYKFTVQV